MQFTKYPPYYPHGNADPHLAVLRRLKRLSVKKAVRFFNVWRPLSRHQPQILLILASVFRDPDVQKIIIKGNAEEEGGWIDGHDPHWVLLDNLIKSMGGKPQVVARFERMMVKFENSLRRPMTEATAAGILAGIENPALDISRYFHEVVCRSGFGDLLKHDLYLTIHVKVEPHHIIDSHVAALEHMNRSLRERKEVLAGFARVMNFWAEFWDAAFRELDEDPIAA